MQEITKCFTISNVKTHNRHHVKLHGHGDDVEADDGGDPEVEILGGDQLVDHKAEGAKVNVVGSLHHS